MIFQLNSKNRKLFRNNFPQIQIYTLCNMYVYKVNRLHNF